MTEPIEQALDRLMRAMDAELEKNDRMLPNFTQYQLAVQEVAATSPAAAAAFARIRHALEQKYTIATLDDVIKAPQQ